VRESTQDIFFAGDTSSNEALLVAQAVDGVSLNERQARTTLHCVLSHVKATPTIYLPSHDFATAQRLELRTTVAFSA
jgi:N-acyl homoserine lactone hydrolase